MINLIPPEGHKAARREYYARVFGSVGFLISGILICLAIAMVPMYILINSQIAAMEVQIDTHEIGMTVDEAKNQVKEIKTVLTQLQTTDKIMPASSIIDEIERLTPATVRLESIFLDAAKDGQKVQIRGVAKTRSELAQYKTSLEEADMFTKAEIPISDLVKESDLPFGLTLTIKK